MLGLDISNHQAGIDLSKGHYDFCIIKATEGSKYIDPSFNVFARQLIELDKLIGCYHFGRPDLYGTVEGARKEANHFVNTIDNAFLLNRSILVLDWETEPVNREDLVEAWINEVYTLTGIVPFIYGSKSKLNSWYKWECLQKSHIWVAQWPGNYRYTCGERIDISGPTLKGDLKYKIWQYESKGIYPGFDGNVDLDTTTLTIEEWKEIAGYPSFITEKISPDMQWAIHVGLFQGYSDGLYHPTDPLTREQAASLFRRFRDIYIP